MIRELKGEEREKQGETQDGARGGPRHSRGKPNPIPDEKRKKARPKLPNPIPDEKRKKARPELLTPIPDEKRKKARPELLTPWR